VTLLFTSRYCAAGVVKSNIGAQRRNEPLATQKACKPVVAKQLASIEVFGYSPNALAHHKRPKGSFQAHVIKFSIPDTPSAGRQ
jgi:hypothetical protein